MKTHEEKIESAARMLCAAHWRGRIEAAKITDDSRTVDAIVKAATDANLQGWRHSANILVSLIED